MQCKTTIILTKEQLCTVLFDCLYDAHRQLNIVHVHAYRYIHCNRTSILMNEIHVQVCKPYSYTCNTYAWRCIN